MNPRQHRRHERPIRFHHDPENPSAHGPHAEFGIHAAARPFGAGPWGGRMRGRGRARRGDVRAVILFLLKEAPSNGYGIIKTIAERTGGSWRPSPGSVYPTLQQLVDEDLIAPSGEGRRTEFALTEAGAAYVEEHAEEIAQAWNAAPNRTEQERAFHESVGKLMRVVGQFPHAATDAQREAAIERLDETRRALYLILAE